MTKYRALASGSFERLEAPENPQSFDDHDRHRWYNFVLGFSDKLVSQMMDVLRVEPGQLVLDPFCGTGTTLVESMKRGIKSVGVDASPFSCFVSRVKTDPKLNASQVMSVAMDVREMYRRASRDKVVRTQTYQYLSSSGMIERGWIGDIALRDALALRQSIIQVAPNASVRDALLLALTSNISTQIGNMRYGPEIYCGPAKSRVDVWQVFQKNVVRMIQDLPERSTADRIATVIKGDARGVASLLRRRGIKRVHAAISSPPYPAEHDYTRNTRLELAFLNFVESAEDVQTIKRSMIRSHTKGIYKQDNDQAHVAAADKIRSLADRVARNSRDKTHGFARLYPRVVLEYFGGMHRHLRSVATCMVPGGRYALVVGDQASYLGTHVRTADLLADLAEDCGFKKESLFVWRTRTSTVGTREIKEHALILRRTAS